MKSKDVHLTKPQGAKEERVEQANHSKGGEKALGDGARSGWGRW